MDVDMHGNKFELQCLQCTEEADDDACFNSGEYVTCVEGVSFYNRNVTSEI